MGLASSRFSRSVDPLALHFSVRVEQPVWLP